MVILWSLLQSLKEEKDVFTIRAWKLNISSCCFVCNQGGWRGTRGSFATCSGSDTQFRLPEAHCCHRIYLTVGAKQHSMLWLGLNAVWQCLQWAPKMQRKPRERPVQAKCRRLLPSRLVLRRTQHALRNGETYFLSRTRNVAAKMEQISDCYALKFGVLDILIPLELKSLVLTCAI